MDCNPKPIRHRNLWAPWRMEYIDSLANEDAGCFLCRDRDHPADDRQQLVLWRGEHSFVVLNRFPYTSGHLLVAPLAHQATLGELDDPTLLEIQHHLVHTQELLSQAIRAQGFNVGINVGRCAGAGLPGHLHYHIVPRWNGDTNFMPVFAGVRVIPQSLTDLYDHLQAESDRLGLPRRPDQP